MNLLLLLLPQLLSPTTMIGKMIIQNSAVVVMLIGINKWERQ